MGDRLACWSRSREVRVSATVRQDEHKAMITEDRLPKPGHIGSKTGYGVLILTEVQ